MMDMINEIENDENYTKKSVEKIEKNTGNLLTASRLMFQGMFCKHIKGR